MVFESFVNLFKVDYFNNILRTAKNISTNLLIGADLWQTEWDVEYFEGTMEDSVGDILPKLDFGVIFRSKFDDWFSDCQNGFGEGWCP